MSTATAPLPTAPTTATTLTARQKAIKARDLAIAAAQAATANAKTALGQARKKLAEVMLKVQPYKDAVATAHAAAARCEAEEAQAVARGNAELLSLLSDREKHEIEFWAHDLDAAFEEATKMRPGDKGPPPSTVAVLLRTVRDLAYVADPLGEIRRLRDLHGIEEQDWPARCASDREVLDAARKLVGATAA